MRSDPGRGEQIRSYAAFEANVRDTARTYWGEGFGRDSLSGMERNRFFLNHHGEQFADLSGLSGLDHTGDGRSLALLDFDRDGRQDLVVASANAPKLTLFHNEIGLGVGEAVEQQPKPTVAIRLVGGNRGAASSPEWSNRDSIGAAVRAEIDGAVTLRHLQAGEGFSAQNSQTLLLPVGRSGEVRNIQIRWPSGKIRTAASLEAGTLATFFENPDDAPDAETSRSPGLVLSAY